METTPVVSKIKIHVSMKEKQINAEQIWKLSKTNRASRKLKHPDTSCDKKRVYSQRRVSLLWPRCHFEEDKVLLCCRCKLPFSLLAIVHIVHCAAC